MLTKIENNKIVDKSHFLPFEERVELTALISNKQESVIIEKGESLIEEIITKDLKEWALLLDLRKLSEYTDFDCIRDALNKQAKEPALNESSIIIYNLFKDHPENPSVFDLDEGIQLKYEKKEDKLEPKEVISPQPEEEKEVLPPPFNRPNEEIIAQNENNDNMHAWGLFIAKVVLGLMGMYLVFRLSAGIYQAFKGPSIPINGLKVQNIDAVSSEISHSLPGMAKGKNF